MNIHTKAGRARLKPRREPYWRLLQKGQHIGYRKTATGGHWIARLTVNRKKMTHALSAPPDKYDIATKQAEEWFATRGTDNRLYTLQDAISAHLKYLDFEKTPSTLTGTMHTFKSIPPSLLSVPVMELTTQQLLSWRDSFRHKDGGRANKNTCNRRWADLRAALNRAYRDVASISSDAAWRKIQPYKGVLQGRDIFFTDNELAGIMIQSAEIDHDFYLLCKAGAVTGARIGELRNIKVKHFDPADSSCAVTGKTGARIMYLSDAACALFVERCKGKQANDYLLDYHGEKWPVQQHGRLFRQITGLPTGSCFYCLRHYYASKALVTPGVTTEMVAKNIGTSVAMIEKFYGKFTAQQQKDTANRIQINI